jgi:hypothetical protein
MEMRSSMLTDFLALTASFEYTAEGDLNPVRGASESEMDFRGNPPERVRVKGKNGREMAGYR